MAATWRTVRVFISSTFRDMQAERDHLVRFAFPRLRERLLPRRIHLVDVDLRWGVTGEQDASEVCREIISECRPRFLCMLGGRYGTIPEGKGLSITADEVHFGVLDAAGEKVYAFFYFRHGAVTEQMDESSPGLIREESGSEKARKLAQLKRGIRQARGKPFLYRPRWNAEERRLVDLKAFGDRVERDILATIDDEFGVAPPAAVDEFAEENAAMEAFVEERSQRFVLGSREGVLKELLDHARATGGNGYVCLAGASGSGKSALLAHLSRQLALAGEPSPLVIRHFVGASPGSTDVRRTLRRLCHELKAACPEITAEVPDDPEKLRAAMPGFLQQACASRRVVILLDGVNQLDAARGSGGLHWLPEELPPNARFILSSIEGPALAELRRRAEKPREIALRPLAAADAEAIIEQFRRRYRKGFEPDQRAALLAKKDSGSPLYLLAALEELRTLGTYEEIGRRIAELPTTTQELLTWILRRLEDDDGFRDASGRRVGRTLVRRFAALMSASRHGLSQDELANLLDPADPGGNVAALVHLLRPYLMRRGELLDFYHGEFRSAAREAALATDGERRAAHRQLAEYFRWQVEPEVGQEWHVRPRALGELPFHLAHGGGEADLRELFSRLVFLAARVAAGQVYEQVADYALAGSSPPSGLADWQGFLQKHAQRLAQHPDMLVALVNHEGFPEARSQVGGVAWRRPWLRTTPEPMPAAEAKVPSGMHVEVSGSIECPWSRPSAIAAESGVAFALERVGAVRVLDTVAMRETDVVLSIARERPLVFACSPDAAGLCVFYESGKAELYRSVFAENVRPARLELVSRFDFLLPETEDPVVVWDNGAFWYQANAGTLASICVASARPAEEPLPAGQQGELSALVFAGGGRLVALREGGDTVILVPGAPPLRRASAYAAAACACGAGRAAVVFTDGSLVVYEISEAVTAKAELRVGMIRGVLGWDGLQLMWLAENGTPTAWRPEDASARPVQDNQEVFPNHLHILPRQWLARPDGFILLGTTHSVVAFRVSDGRVAADGRMEALFGGPVWRVIRKRENDQWLLERHQAHEMLLGRGVTGRLFCAADGKGRFYNASGYGPGLVFDLATFRPAPLEGCPPGVNAAVGEDEGGCWLADRTGDVYFADEAGRCRLAMKLGLSEVHGSNLENCAEHLVWWGYSGKFFADTGAEPARTLVFLRKVRAGALRLDRVGEQFRHPREGLCLDVRWDRAARRLLTLWVREADGAQVYFLRVGPVEEFARWQFQEIEVSGLGPSKFVQASLSADGRLVGVVNMAGEFSCLSVADGRVVATLAASTPFGAVAAGEAGRGFWLAEGGAKVFQCELIGETT